MINYIFTIGVLFYALYINYSWCKHCNELNDRWAEHCNELNTRWSKLYRKAVFKKEEKK